MEAIRTETLAETIRRAEKEEEQPSYLNTEKELCTTPTSKSYGLYYEFVTNKEQIFTVKLDGKKHLMFFRTYNAYNGFYDKAYAKNQKGKDINYSYPWFRPANKAAKEQTSNPEEWNTTEGWKQVDIREILAVSPITGELDLIKPYLFSRVMSERPDLDVTITTK